MKLTINTFVSLDGVMQAPGGPEEDTRNDFKYGGWTTPFGDDDFGRIVVSHFDTAEAFLLGRRTYDIFANYWPQVTDQTNPIAEALNQKPKYVVSTTLKSTEWNASTVINGDVVAEIQALKEKPGQDLQVHGSGNLAQTLIKNNLIDEYRIFTFPVLLGSGYRLFGDGTVPGALERVGGETSKSGMSFNVYRPIGEIVIGNHVEDGKDTAKL